MAETITQKIPHGIMTRTLWLCDDIRMGHTISATSQLSSVQASSKQDIVRVHFGLKGDYRFSYKQLNRSFDLIGGHHNIMYSKDFDMVVENKTLEVETFGIQFPTQHFIQYTYNSTDQMKRFAEDIIQGKSVILSENWGAIEPAIQQVIQQIIHHKYSGDLEKLFLLSKSIELLVLSAESYLKPTDEMFIKSKADKEKIIAVRDLINQRVHHPPNLTEIAKTVGLNEYKLKRGFKETFSTTVFGYLTDQRLHLARRYLLDTDKTAVQISIDLGYTTPQHFNNVFKKKFGITPDSIRNNP
jgi:AraC family transcriptional regulator, transcriptional activator of the genes for pyochelin and ferripyochelin receptors